MEGAGAWRQDTVVYLCLSLFVTLFFHCSFLLTHLLCYSMGLLWATVPEGVCLFGHGASLLVLLLPHCPLCFTLPSLFPPLWHFLPFPECVFTELPHRWSMGSALARGGSIAEWAGISCEQHGAAPITWPAPAPAQPGGKGSIRGQSRNCLTSHTDVGVGRSVCIVRLLITTPFTGMVLARDLEAHP